MTDDAAQEAPKPDGADDATLPAIQTGQSDVSPLEKLNRSQRSYGWAVSAPLFLIGGFFALRFLSAAMDPMSGGQSGFLNLGIAIFTLMIGFLVYTKHQQDQSADE